MSISLTSKLGQVDAALAKAGVSKEDVVHVRVLSEEDSLKLDSLRAAIQEGLNSGPGRSADDVFDELFSDYPALKPAE